MCECAFQLNACIFTSFYAWFYASFLFVIHELQWWSLETWSRSRDPFLRVSVSKVSGLVSVSKVSGLETLNIQRKWFINISLIWFWWRLHISNITKNWLSKTSINQPGAQRGGKGGHNSPGANSLCGRWITAGAPNYCWRRRKVLTMSQVLSLIQ